MLDTDLNWLCFFVSYLYLVFLRFFIIIIINQSIIRNEHKARYSHQ